MTHARYLLFVAAVAAGPLLRPGLGELDPLGQLVHTHQAVRVRVNPGGGARVKGGKKNVVVKCAQTLPYSPFLFVIYSNLIANAPRTVKYAGSKYF